MTTTNDKPFVNPFQIPQAVTATLAARTPRPVTLRPVAGVAAATATAVLDRAEIDLLGGVLNAQPWIPVGTNGILDDYRDGDRIGSFRASTYDETFAAILYDRLAPALPATRTFDTHAATDWDGHATWRPVGINPLLRFIRYDHGGLLVPHYDAPYDHGDGRHRTLMTVVLYLRHTADPASGQTRFIADPQASLPLTQRDHADWDRYARPEEITGAVPAVPGDALLFDHRILHDCAPVTGDGQKIILRTDVVFEKA